MITPPRRRPRRPRTTLGKARYQQYFELGLVGMAVTSLEKGWLEVNDRLCEILGYSREELTTKTWTDLTHPDDVAPDVAQFNRVLAGDIYRRTNRYDDAVAMYRGIKPGSLYSWSAQLSVADCLRRARQ